MTKIPIHHGLGFFYLLIPPHHQCRRHHRLVGLAPGWLDLLAVRGDDTYLDSLLGLLAHIKDMGRNMVAGVADKETGR